MGMQAAGIGMVASATTMLSRAVTRRAMHGRDGAPRLPRAARQRNGFGTILLLAVAAGAVLAFADLLKEQRTRAAKS